jgi:cell division protein FtsQ
MSPTATPTRPAPGLPRSRWGMDPRIRDRRTAVTREQGRRRLRIVLGALVVVAALVGVWFLLHTPLFSARRFSVTGNVHETVAQVVAQSGLAAHPPLLDINASQAAARLEGLPWVQSATVRVAWPDSVHITVVEEVPKLEMAEASGQWASLSDDGRVLALSAARPPGLVTLAGPQPAGAVGTVLGGRDQPGLAVATSLPPSFVAQVTQVTVEPAGWVQLSMTTPIAVDIGTATELAAKYEDITSILAGATLHDGAVIDVSVPGAPTVTGG